MRAAAARFLEATQAHVVGEPFHERRAKTHAVRAERLGHEGKVADEDLFLERPRGRGYDDLAPAQDGRHKVRERLARPRSRLDEKVMLLLERTLHRLGHGELALA